MKKAMITIEVLISMLILFLVISTSFTTIKFFNIQIKKRVNYEDKYINFLTLKDKLSNKICKNSLVENGTFNGFSYSAKCEKVKELRTFKKAFDEDEVSGNIGNYLMTLYKVTLQLKKNNFTHSQSYFLTRSKKIL